LSINARLEIDRQKAAGQIVCTCGDEQDMVDVTNITKNWLYTVTLSLFDAN
jgi:hypothetical protein